jgi:hypothetical protein
MPDPRLRRLVDQLRASRFADLQGTTIAISLPVSERLLNEIVVAALPAASRVKDVSLHPAGGNRIRLTARVADFLPPLSMTLQIVRQPDPPGTPLVLALPPVAGLLALGGAGLVSSVLPPGVRLDGTALSVDVERLLRERGLDEVLPLMKKLEVTTEPGRLVLRLDLRVD